MYNCDVYADVDFGRGPVEVRCTVIYPHEVHKCEVFFPDEAPIQDSNAFTPKEDVSVGQEVVHKKVNWFT